MIMFFHSTGFHTSVSKRLHTWVRLHKSLLSSHSKIRITKSLGRRLKPCPGFGFTFLITLLLFQMVSCWPDGGDGVFSVWYPWSRLGESRPFRPGRSMKVCCPCGCLERRKIEFGFYRNSRMIWTYVGYFWVLWNFGSFSCMNFVSSMVKFYQISQRTKYTRFKQISWKFIGKLLIRGCKLL